MTSSKCPSTLLIRFLHAVSVFYFMGNASPQAGQTMHSWVHVQDLSHAHEQQGSDHTHDHDANHEDKSSISKVPVHLPTASSFVFPVKVSFSVIVPFEPVALPSPFVSLDLIPFSAAPPSSDYLTLLLASHPNKAPPSA